MKLGTAAHFYHYDGVGSTRLLTDGAGAASDTYDYDAFGNLIASTGTTPNVYLFTGEQLDPNMGFYFLRSRYMAPEFGRFITADTFPGFIFDPPSLHKYSYANNDPVNMIDPTGQFSLASVSVSVSISSILSSIAISHFGFALVTIIIIKHFFEPGFEMRNGALLVIASTGDSQVQADAFRVYQHGNFLIALGAALIGITGTITQFTQSFAGLAGSIKV